MTSQFLNILSHDFNRLLDEGEDCDVKIYVGEEPTTKIFSAHSIVLRARSSYFRAALSKGWAKVDSGLIVFSKPNISPTVFRIVLKYIYSGTICFDDIEAEEILQLLVAVDELCLDELLLPIQDYLFFHKSEWLKRNMVLVHETASQHDDLVKLHDYCEEIISNEPAIFFNSNDFPYADETLVISLLRRQDLAMEEIEIWQHLIGWGIAQDPTLESDISTWTDEEFKALRATLKNCITHIRFFDIAPTEFEEKVKPFHKIIPVDVYSDIILCQNSPWATPKSNVPPARCWIDSKIVNYEHVGLISSWIDGNAPLELMPSRRMPHRFKLLLRGTRDGFSPNTFRELCNNQGATVVILKMKDAQEIVGGYNPIEWGYAENGWINTAESFIFTLGDGVDLGDARHARAKKSNRSIYDRFNCGPRFGSEDLGMGLAGQDFDEVGSCGCRKNYYRFEISTTVRFAVEEYEVFQVTTKMT